MFESIDCTIGANEDQVGDTELKVLDDVALCLIGGGCGEVIVG